MIYIASPYTSVDVGEMNARFLEACIALSRLSELGVPAFVPIAHSGYAHLHYRATEDRDYWMAIGLDILKICSSVMVLQLDGWKDSVGIKEELKEARELGLPITYVTLGDLDRQVQEYRKRRKHGLPTHLR